MRPPPREVHSQVFATPGHCASTKASTSEHCESDNLGERSSNSAGPRSVTERCSAQALKTSSSCGDISSNPCVLLFCGRAGSSCSTPIVTSPTTAIAPLESVPSPTITRDDWSHGASSLRSKVPTRHILAAAESATTSSASMPKPALCVANICATN